MKTLFFIVSLQLFSVVVYAEECTVTTRSRSLESNKALLSKEILDEKTGHYIATYKNGDLLIAYSDPCDLAMYIHFYSRELISATAQINKLYKVFSMVRDNPELVDKLKSQIKADAVFVNGQPITLTGIGDSHEFVFQTDESPLFRSAIHYSWNPPTEY